MDAEALAVSAEPDTGLAAFHLLAPAAANSAPPVDALFTAMLLLCGTVALVVCVLVLVFALRYRRGSKVPRHEPRRRLRWLEIAWTLTPLALFAGIYAWAAHDYIRLYQPPPDALPVYVVAKQWMWKLQHRNGRREINELHVPLGQPVLLKMTSQDAIHSFYAPAFRLKQDVLPGRYTSLWFTATRLGWHAYDVGLAFTFIGCIVLSMQGFLIGPLTRWMGERWVLSLGLVILATGTAMTWGVFSMTLMAISILCTAGGFGMVNPSINSLISRNADDGRQGLTMGVNQAMAALGRVAGPVFGGLLFDEVGITLPYLIGGAMLLLVLAFGWRTIHGTPRKA